MCPSIPRGAQLQGQLTAIHTGVFPAWVRGRELRSSTGISAGWGLSSMSFCSVPAGSLLCSSSFQSERLQGPHSSRSFISCFALSSDRPHSCCQQSEEVEPVSHSMSQQGPRKVQSLCAHSAHRATPTSTHPCSAPAHGYPGALEAGRQSSCRTKGSPCRLGHSKLEGRAWKASCFLSGVPELGKHLNGIRLDRNQDSGGRGSTGTVINRA